MKAYLVRVLRDANDLSRPPEWLWVKYGRFDDWHWDDDEAVVFSTKRSAQNAARKCRKLWFIKKTRVVTVDLSMEAN